MTEKLNDLHSQGGTAIPRDEKGNGLDVIPVDGGEARLVLKKKEGIERPCWLPDGRHVAFLSFVCEEQEDVKVIRRIGFGFNYRGFIYGVRREFLPSTWTVTNLNKSQTEISISRR